MSFARVESPVERGAREVFQQALASGRRVPTPGAPERYHRIVLAQWAALDGTGPEAWRERVVPWREETAEDRERWGAHLAEQRKR